MNYSYLRVVILVIAPLGGGGDEVLCRVADGQLRGVARTRRARLEQAHEAVRRQKLSSAHLSDPTNKHPGVDPCHDSQVHDNYFEAWFTATCTIRFLTNGQ